MQTTDKYLAGFGTASRPTFGAASTGFGANNTNSGGGLFGSTQAANTNTTSPFGGGNAFGSTNTTTSPFGQNTNASGGSSLFGSTPAKPASAFGGFGSATSNTPPATGFGGGFGAANGATNQGTAVTPFDPLKEKEPASNVTSIYQSISCMPAYQKFSFEELREQDYAQGRRYGNTTGAGAFGKPTGFGSGTFGQPTSAFGQPANNSPSPGLFGNNNASNNTSGGFGSSNAFGANNNNTSGGLFGQKPATGGLFGSTNTNPSATGGGLFGNTNTGAFGSTNAATSAPAFGQSNTATSFGGFGASNNQAKPAFGTGATGGFGGFGASSNNTSAAPAFGSGTPSAFGSTNNNTGTGLFGNTNANTGFGQTNTSAPSTFGGFGTTNNTATSQPSTFGGFGATTNNNNNNSNQAKPAFGGFGSGFGATNNTTSAPSLFGQNNQNNQQKPAFGFGQTQPNQQQAQTGGLFGSTTNAQPAGASLFGNTNSNANTSGGLFGAANNNTQSSGGLFGAKPQTGGLFSSTQPQQTGGLFGVGNNASTGGFGATNNNSMFGNSGQQQVSSMFGGSQNGLGLQQQNPLQASIDQNPFGANPLFSTAGQNPNSPGPIATPISNGAQKKKPALLPTYKLSPRPASSPRPKAAVTRSSSGSISSASGSSAPLMSKSLLFDGLADKAILSSEAFSPRNDIRKLVIDKRVTESDLLTGGGDLSKYVDTPSKEPKEPVKSNTMPEMKELPTGSSIFAKTAPVVEKEAPATPAVASAADKAISNTANTLQPAHNYSSPAYDSDGYWSYPSRSALRKMSLKELSHVEDYQVGRRGYGEVTFNSPVDLSTFAHPEQIPGQYVIFGKKTCTVYPDDHNKPEVGKGLNVPGTVTLENCWPTKKDTKEPILDPDHPAVPRHLQRLKSVPGTKFLTYMADKGTWVFSVEHFSVWGLLDDSGDEYDETSEPVKVTIQPESQTQSALRFPAVQKPAVYGFSPMKTDDVPFMTPQKATADVSMSSPAEYDASPSLARLPGGWNASMSSQAQQHPFLAGGDTFKISQPSVDSEFRPSYQEEEEEMISDEDKEEAHQEDDEGVPDNGSVLGREDENYDDYELEEKTFKPVDVPVGHDWIEQLVFADKASSLWNEAETTRLGWLEETKFTNRLEDFKFSFADLDSAIFGGDRFVCYPCVFKEGLILMILDYLV